MVVKGTGRDTAHYTSMVDGHLPIGRWSTPEEVAKAVLFLAVSTTTLLGEAPLTIFLNSPKILPMSPGSCWCTMVASRCAEITGTLEMQPFCVSYPRQCDAALGGRVPAVVGRRAPE